MLFKRLGEYNIKESVGERLNITFLANEVTVRNQRNDGKFLTLDMVDGNNKQGAIMFSITDKIEQEVKDGIVFDAMVDIKPYKGSISCVIDDLKVSEVPVSEFIAWDGDMERNEETIKKAIEVIGDTVYGKITKAIVESKWDRFRVWTAAKGKHHTELGGLLAHTAQTARMALQIGQELNNVYGDDFIDLNLLLAGSILHDIGKVDELVVNTSNGKADYSNESALRSHIMNVLSYVDRVAIKEGLEDTKEVMLLKHTLAAHHGILEWGSPVAPAIPEASLLHYIDLLGAKMYKFNRELKSLESGKSKIVWNGGGEKYYKA